MPMIPFLPGLMLALAVWILPPAVRILPRQILAPLDDRAPWLAPLAPWLRGIALPYLGLLLGWISARDYGLTGHTPAEWALGAAAAVILGIVLGRLSVRLSLRLGWRVVCDEARWTLYRAAVWPWVGYLPLAVAAALAAAWAEFAWGRKSGGEKLFDEVGLLFLLHAAGSAVLFLLAHNIFLAVVFYLSAVMASNPDFNSRAIEMINGIRKKL
jgi:hypothetical protein